MIDEAENKRKNSQNSSHHHNRRTYDSMSKSRDYHSRRDNPRDLEIGRKDRPAFKRPRGDDDFRDSFSSRRDSRGSKNWQKPEVQEKHRKERLESITKDSQSSLDFKTQKVLITESSSVLKSNEEDDSILTEAEMNKLGAKIVKAEIMGDDVNKIAYMIIHSNVCN